jgi:hypothetical protein
MWMTARHALARVLLAASLAAGGLVATASLFANGSALRKVATKTATLNVDSRFKKRFKVPSVSTRCKVVVRFQGAKLGQRKFKC